MARPHRTLHTSAEAAEAAFYEALQNADVEALMDVWGDDDDIVCVHPGGPRLVGAVAVRASFEQLLASGPLHIVPERVVRQMMLGGAVHAVVERVLVREEGVEPSWTREGEHNAVAVQATNVYAKTPEGWRMVLHHASPAGQDEGVEAVSDLLH